MLKRGYKETESRARSSTSAAAREAAETVDARREQSARRAQGFIAKHVHDGLANPRRLGIGWQGVAET
jgi:hypothetical protein